MDEVRDAEAIASELGGGEAPIGARRRLKAERPGQILEAAFDEFTQQGFAATRLEDVARRVGVTKGTIYLYFESKVELFKAVVRAYTLRPFEESEAAIASFDGSKVELLKYLILDSYKDLLDKPNEKELMRLLIAEGPKFPELTDFYHEEVMARFEAATRAVLEAGIASGEFKSKAVEEFPLILFGPMVLACTWELIFDRRHPIDMEAYKAAHVELVLNGLLTKPQPAA